MALVKPDLLLVVRPKDLPLRFLSSVVVSDLQRKPEPFSAFKQLNQDPPELAESHNKMTVIYAVQNDQDAARVSSETTLVADYSSALAPLNIASNANTVNSRCSAGANKSTANKTLDTVAPQRIGWIFSYSA